MNSNVGRNIRRLRTERSMTQESLAERLSVTRQTVSQWERGGAYPDLDTLEHIAQALDGPLLAVIYGGEAPAARWGVFPNAAQRRIFAASIGLALLGLALPWFSVDPQVCGWVWGLPLDLLILPVFLCGAAWACLPSRTAKSWQNALTELALLSLPLSETYWFFSWYGEAGSFMWAPSLSRSLSLAYPGFYIALTLALLPLIFYPLCRKKSSSPAEISS